MSLTNEYNGNGDYSVSLLNRDYISGIPIGNWRINRIGISYNWINNSARFKMEDEVGNETNYIRIKTSRNSNLQLLIEKVFSKAQEIVQNYPNAKIYNAIIELKENEEKLVENKNYGSLNCLDEENFRQFYDHVSRYLKILNDITDGIKYNEDIRRIRLIKEISTNCKDFLDNLVESNK